MIHTFNPQKDPYVQQPLLNTLRKNSKNFIIFLRLSLIFLLDKLHKLPNHCANNKVNYNKNENKEGETRKYFDACEKNNFHSHLSRKNFFKKISYFLLVLKKSNNLCSIVLSIKERAIILVVDVLTE